MKTVVIREHGDLDQLHLEDREIPSPGPKEVRVQIRAAALNHLDTWVRRGVPGHTFPLPIIPGCDGAGVIDAVGPGVDANGRPNRHLAVGSEVVLAPGFGCGLCELCARGEDALCRHYGILGETCDGTCAEYVVVPAQLCLPKPTNLSFEEAASMPLTFLTAWHMLTERAQVKPGDVVLVQAAGSGVGVASVQIAKLFGATVIATAGSDAKLDRARALGADHTIHYGEKDFLAEVKTLTQRAGVDIAIDHVGQPTIARSIAALKKGGALVTCGATGGFQLEVDLRLIFFKSLSVLGSTMGSRGELFDILKLAQQGRLLPVVHSVLPMEEIQEAHRILGAREVFGKVIVNP